MVHHLLLRSPVMAFLVLAWLSGCVGGIDDPERFGDGSFCPPEVDVEQLFVERCGGAICHGAGGSAGGLDLESPGAAERMIDVPAQVCSGWELIAPGDPNNSFLISKLEGPPPGCGDPMPPVGHLSENEITCVRRWVIEVSGEASADGGGQ
ncbi:MAG: hypothetical protein H5U40_15435 [Polyangiaceae bacterium]|nr:hypothetical protein [Polyangiaceae bacterium]